jgi:RNA polymerase sigma-70 factor (ECF subfamily)
MTDPSRLDESTPGDAEFVALLKRVRAGDADAAAELVRRYEPMVRRVARVRMVDPRLRTAMDSIDLCQSVLASFFVRYRTGQYQVLNASDLVKLLAQMARNKVGGAARKATALRRDLRRQNREEIADQGIADAAASPSRVVAARDLLATVQRRMTPEARQIAQWRAEGDDWSVIGARLGMSSEAVRKRFFREVDSIAKDLDLDNLRLGQA